MKIDFRDKTVGGFTFEFVRGLSAEESGAAAFGECMETIDHVKDGDFESWIVHWTATADRVSAVAEREPFEHFAQALGRGDLWSLA